MEMEPPAALGGLLSALGVLACCHKGLSAFPDGQPQWGEGELAPSSGELGTKL